LLARRSAAGARRREVTTQTPIKLRIQGDLIDLTQEHDPQDILRAHCSGRRARVINTTVGRVIFNDSIPPGCRSSTAR
jgi:hypothetical protein